MADFDFVGSLALPVERSTDGRGYVVDGLYYGTAKAAARVCAPAVEAAILLQSIAQSKEQS